MKKLKGFISKYETPLIGIGLFVFLSLYAVFIASSFNMIGNYLTKNIQQSTENIVYHNESDKQSTVRYKYHTSYETVDDKIDEKTQNSPVYSLYINDELVAVAYLNDNLPVVSDAQTVKGNQSLEKTFHVEVNDNVDKSLLRIDVKVVIEELRSGKWTPVYQVIFMERGPYWSLDKGPVEQLEDIDGGNY